MNYADSEKINMILLQSGLRKVLEAGDADIIILNTCSVRQKWEDRVYGYIRDARALAERQNKKLIVGVTGCMIRKTGLHSRYYESDRKRKAAKNIELISDTENIKTWKNDNIRVKIANRSEAYWESTMSEEAQDLNSKIEVISGLFNSDDKIFGVTDTIDFTLRIEEIHYLTKILSLITKTEIGNDAKWNEYLQIKQTQDNPGSANIIIQTGCDNFCSFCIVPYTRGREKSRPRDEILTEIQECMSTGTKEVTLLGQNVNSYGKETKKKLWNEEELKWDGSISEKTPFRELLDGVNAIPGLDRIRFTSSNPHDMTKDILDAHFELPKMCNYLHFALQSGSDELLRSMNRKHTFADFRTQLEYLRSHDPLFSISTDIIVGFPGETEEQFQETVRAFQICEFDFAFIARYSPRRGTRATDSMEDTVSMEEKARRWDILNTLLYQGVQKRNGLMVGRTEELLISAREKDEQLVGRTRNFKEVYIADDGKIQIGDLVAVKITEMDRWVLKWEVV